MAYKPFKMKGHTLPGINQKGYKNMDNGQSTSAPFQDHVKGAKTVNDYLKEGFSQVEAEQMHKDGATTGETPAKFLGGAFSKIKDIGSKMLKGKDGKFGWKDAGRLALGGPMLGGALGLMATEEGMKAKKKIDKKKKNTPPPNTPPPKGELNEWGETKEQYIARMKEMGLRK
tara:strand:+ start:824 stop:1339 length:516 start_codon:yes stop_codon:yes gene_type:complete